MRRSFLFVMAVLCAVVPATVPATSAQADNWLTYHNDRYGTTIDYPDQLKTEPPPGSDDSRTFKSAARPAMKINAAVGTPALRKIERLE